MLQSITATKRTFICVDALDECVPENLTVVLESLAQILQGSPGTRIFITGRPHVRSEVERTMGGAATFIFIRTTEDGVLRFLREKLRKDRRPNMMSSALEREIMESIPAMSSETYVGAETRAMPLRLMADMFKFRFLLASLHIEAILRGATVARRRKALKLIKDGGGLAGAYGATLERIKAQDEENTKLAMTALTWVCHAERPLQVDELCNALAVEIGSPDFDPENIPSIGTLLHFCQGLITVDEESSTVRLIHHTVQEHLDSDVGLFSKPHSILAETCLTYLNSKQVKNLRLHPFPDHHSMPFLAYSSRYWGAHARRELSDHASTLALELLGQYENHVSAISLLKQVPRGSFSGDTSIPPLFTGLHGASFFGIVELVTTILSFEGCEINQQDCTGTTPLGWAARNGHVGAVELLLGREGIDPDRPGEHDETPLGRAAIYGHEAVIKLLLRREGVDPNNANKYGETPLGRAAIEGHEGVVKLLLGREDIDPNRPGEHGRTPLGWATLKGHGGVVKLLLEREDVDSNRPDKHNQTPLRCAAIEGREEMVRLLLKRKDINPNRPDDNDRTPLGCAALEGHEAVVKLLLERGDVDPNRPDKHNQTPLRCAAIQGREEIVRLLLKRTDINPNRPDANDRTPLGCAALEGHEGVVKLLLEREDVDPNRPDKYNQTPLKCATRRGNQGVVKLLLERGDVDLDRSDKGDIARLRQGRT